MLRFTIEAKSMVDDDEENALTVMDAMMWEDGTFSMRVSPLGADKKSPLLILKDMIGRWEREHHRLAQIEEASMRYVWGKRNG